MADEGKRSRSRRFLPPDPRVEGPHRLTPQIALRVGLLGAVALGVFAVLFLRLWALQVLSGNDYLQAALKNQLRTVRLESPRGPIQDRHGRVLVTNQPGTVVRIWPADLPKQGRYTELRRLSEILDLPLARISAEIRKRRGDPLTPVTLPVRVTEQQVNYIMERRAQFPGVQIADTYLRRYTHGALAAHVLGHVGEISEEQLKGRLKQGYRAGDKIGQGGVEAKFDRFLRGRPGLAQLRVDSLGRPQSAPTENREPSAGHAVRLTLDLKLQQAAERALRDWIARAREQDDCEGCWAANGGAIVALDPRNGAVRAMASAPSYHPSLYVGRVDEEELARAGLRPSTAESRNVPSLNRAIAGVYPAGSTFKPVTAIAAMQERLIGAFDRLSCDPVFEAYKQVFHNWNPGYAGELALAAALEQSCDTYFYRLGLQFYELPEDRGQPLQAWASKFGFGKATGLDIGGEVPGLLPTIPWKKRFFEDEEARLWKPGDSIQLAIGQGDLQVTPLQLARFFALVANGGSLVTPHLVRGVYQVGAGGSSSVPLRRLSPPRPTRIALDQTGLEAVRDGLYLATHGANGTATPVFGGYPISISGKTGTAEKATRLPGWSFTGLVDQAWWCGYGPTDKPELVVCVLIENGGHGGSVAAPAALEVFSEYFGIPAPAQYELPELTD